MHVNLHGNPIPYCIREEALMKPANQPKSCHGEIMTFKQLKSRDVTVNDLLLWNGVIEVIDSYAKYISLSNFTNNDEFYCNCSSWLQFGKYCEYEFNYDIDLFDEDQTFSDFIISAIGLIEYPTNKEVKMEYVTCYVGIRCDNSLPCLDWRQICNGIIDCDHAEDEPFELCLQMEQNECDSETEFRCKNGICVPRYFLENNDQGCLDGTDRGNMFMHITEEGCWFAENLDCAQYSCRWKEYSCGDGECISYSDATSGKEETKKTCSTKRNVVLLKQLFSFNYESQCWKSMICLTGFSHLYANITCSNQKLEADIEQYCPNEYYFPPNPVFYSYVFFLYEKLNRTNWLDYTGPNYICYKKEFCNKRISELLTISKNNLTCFYINQKIFSWMNFSEYVIHLFQPCYSKIEESSLINVNKLYKCELSNTFISLYRLKDKRKDCLFNEDENPNLNLCLFSVKDLFKCITKQNECIQKSSIKDNQHDCSDGSDEFLPRFADHCGKGSSYDHVCRIKLGYLYHYPDLCDGIVNTYLFSEEANETDETDCEHWRLKCENSLFTRCNRKWNCKNGIDEIVCSKPHYNTYIEKALNCRQNQHYCIQLINNNSDINATCLNIDRAGDGIIDCIGGTDERLTSICTKKYPLKHERRFHCMNSSICIEPKQVCDRIIDCPFEDDERVCPWLFKSNSSKFYCQNAPSVAVGRCASLSISPPDCKFREQSWFCDLGVPMAHTNALEVLLLPSYPSDVQNPKAITYESIDPDKLSSIRKTVARSNSVNINTKLCNYGYRVKPLISINQSYCLCSPSYYGNYCQYQHERLTVVLAIRSLYSFSPSTIFRFIIYLLDQNHTITSYDEVLYSLMFSADIRFLIYLLYEKIRHTPLHERSKFKYVRIDAYIVEKTKVQHISSWLFNVSYSFLPVNRLVALLTLENESFRPSRCTTKCGPNGKCKNYLNNKHLEYCWCDQGWLGENCDSQSSSNLCNETSCSPNSQCVILNDKLSLTKCVCPLGKFGNQCYIKYDPCSNITCQNNGTCLPLDPRSLSYICICQRLYQGDHCEQSRPIMRISIPQNISDSDRIPAILVIIAIVNTVMEMRILSTFLYKNVLLPSSIITEAPTSTAFVRLFHNNTNNFYHMIAMRSAGRSSFNTTVISSNRCQNISELFNETVMYQYSYLKRLKLYQLPCYENQDLKCFFDEYRMCICGHNRISFCFNFDHERESCNYCARGSLCIQKNDQGSLMDFICLCPECSFGTLCQFSTGNYFITLDLLIGVEVKTGNVSFNDQSFIIHMILATLITMVLIGFISNMLSLIILKKKLRQVGCDLYLLNLTVISQIGLSTLLLRFLYMIIIQIYLIEDILFIRLSCIFLEYFVRLIPSLFDWLIACISIERAYIVVKDVHFTRLIAMKTLKMSRWMIIIILLFNVLTTLHRTFYLTLIDEPTLYDSTQGHPWCILDLNSISWNNYEKFINIFHLVVPLAINIISIISFISVRTRVHLRSSVRTAETTALRTLLSQVSKYKPLIISTIIIVALEMPRFVLTLGLGCIREKWERYLYLAGHLISFLPLTGTLLIHIVPSPKYRKTLKELYQKTFRLNSREKQKS